MFFPGYAVYQAERTLAPAEQREADARLGRRWAALAQWRRSLARPARARPRQPGARAASPRAGLAVDCGTGQAE